MNSILIVVEKPGETDRFQEKRWSAFSKELPDTKSPDSTTERIAETAWLIRGQNGMPTLGRVLDQAHRHGIACRVLFLEAVTEWVSPSKGA